MPGRRISLLLLSLLLSVVFAGHVAAQNTKEIPKLEPRYPSLYASGSAGAAGRSGFEALFTNPAGFSLSEEEITAFSANAWLTLPPQQLNDGIEAAFGTDAASVTQMEDAYQSSGVGYGASVMSGYVGRGLGLGLYSVGESMLYGSPLPNGIEGYFDGNIGLVAGFSVPFLLEGATFHLGGALRPQIRIHTPLDEYTGSYFSNRLAGSGESPFSMLSGADLYYGYGVAIDMGGVLDFDFFRIGLSIRDLFDTGFTFTRTDFDRFMKTTLFSEGEEIVDTVYVVSSQVDLGLYLRPLNGNGESVFDPQLYFEFAGIQRVLEEEINLPAIIRGGADLELYEFANIGIGYNQGSLTAGGGVDLLFIDIYGAAWFLLPSAAEGGRFYKGGNGISLDLAVRF
ncbi:MAG: hypothetical protein K9L68_00755 [Spirochaetales bacterium]|nr:hypothetical protein [Spirochaetales bacterium]MCF7937106.1 hypothetical protein [Spirochaetales bacterium]